jgi:transcriptional pleiotropic regulator of transition state genes
MKSAGIVRKLDNLGRVVIPVEVRRTMEIEDRDGLEIFFDNDQIILMKYEPSYECVFCGSPEDVSEFKGRTISNMCLDAIRKRNMAMLYERKMWAL